MNALDVLLLLGAGLGAGTINAVAGGGSLVTFPTLLAVGLAPIQASVTNAVAVFPGYVASVYGSRTDLADLAESRGRRPLLSLIPTVVAGTALGCALLLHSGDRAFEVIVPFLVLGATAVLAFQDRLRQAVAHPHDMGPTRRTVTMHLAAGLGAVYGGYFNAALGVMLVAALGLAFDDPLPRVSALKNAISAVVGLGTLVAFGVFGPVNWAAAAIVTPASLLGGYLGARFARRLPSRVLRIVIVAFGTTVGVVLFVRAHR